MSIKDETTAKPAGSIDEIAVKEIEAGSPSYDCLTSKTSARGLQYRESTLNYDALAVIYNRVEPGNLLILALPSHPSTSNLRKIIESRGLKECDYRLFRPETDELGQRYPIHKRPLVLERITGQKMRLIQPFTALAENMAKEAAQRGTSYNFSQPENPVNPRLASQLGKNPKTH